MAQWLEHCFGEQAIARLSSNCRSCCQYLRKAVNFHFTQTLKWILGYWQCLVFLESQKSEFLLYIVSCGLKAWEENVQRLSLHCAIAREEKLLLLFNFFFFFFFFCGISHSSRVALCIYGINSSKSNTNHFNFYVYKIRKTM